MTPEPVLISLMPILVVILIFLSYLNVVETKRNRDMDKKLEQLTDYIKIIADKLNKG